MMETWSRARSFSSIRTSASTSTRHMEMARSDRLNSRCHSRPISIFRMLGQRHVRPHRFIDSESLGHPTLAATFLCFSNGEAVPQAEKCKYLGTQVSWEDPTKTAINHRLQLAKAAYSKLAPFWRSRVPLSVKLRSSNPILFR